MMEMPEAVTIARQMEETVQGKRVRTVVAGHTPHGFAFYNQPHEAYQAMCEHSFENIRSFGNYVQAELGPNSFLLGEGIRTRWYAPGEKLPPKHQMLIMLEDDSALVCSVQMYGGMFLFPTGQFDNMYYRVALEKPSPLGPDFSRDYFVQMAAEAKQNLSAKAFLATEQRIPGLGNGVLQDMLFTAGIHPKRKLETLDETQLDKLYHCVRDLMADMAVKGGRDTEKDLLGTPGGYRTMLHAKAAGKPCTVCGDTIQKQAYLGGSIYFCPTCQPLA